MYSFKIISFHIYDSIQEIGIDSIQFHLEVLKEGRTFYTLLSYRDIYRFCEENLPNVATYLKGVRNNISGFGPKETKVWAILQEEAFEIEPLFYQFIEQHQDWLSPASKPITAEERKAMDEIVRELGKESTLIRDANLRETAFMDKILEDLTARVLEFYPEIFESNSENITMLKDILVKNISNLSLELEALAFESLKDYRKLKSGKIDELE